jgi:site-specific recombinase XerD
MYLRGKSWYSQFWHEGERYTKAWGEISKTTAKEKDADFRKEVREGKHVQKAKRVLFENFCEKYLEYARMQKKPKSAKRNEVSINMLKPHFQGKLLRSIHPFMVEQYKKQRKDEGRAPATINRDVVCIRNMMRKAVEWGYLSQNPLASVKQLREDNEQRWVLTDEEETKLLNACGNSPQWGGKEKRYLRELVLFALHSGMREQEIFGLTKARVNLRDRFLEVVDTKTGENRKVPLNDTLKEILEAKLKDERSDYVFCNAKGKKLTRLTNAFWYAVKEAGLIRIDARTGEKIRFRFHDLRHTFGTRLGMSGADLKTIMEIMGHKTVKVAMSYQHPAPDHKLEAVKILDQPTSKITSAKKEALKVVNITR